MSGFGVLGPLRVPGGGVIGAAKHRAVLAALLLSPGRMVPLDRLMSVVWDGAPPASAEQVLRVYVSALRKVVDGIVTVPGGYVLGIEADEVDGCRFERLVERGRRARDAGRVAEGAALLTEALGLWRGPALADVESGELRRTHAVRLEELRLTALEERVRLDLRLGRGGEVAGELRALVEAYPLREPAWALLMAALGQAGRRSEALEAYGRARRILVEELGLEPGAELRAAHARLLEDEGERSAPLYEAPPDISDFVGREDALRWILAAHRADGTADHGGSGVHRGGAPVRLVVHGAAGTGKSAVAVRAAGLLELPDGVLYASLRDRQPAAMLEDLLRSLGAGDGSVAPGLQERVSAYRSLTATRRILVVLDDATDEAQVRPLLPTGQGSLTLITSRSPLAGLEAARAYELGVLGRDESVRMLAAVVGAERTGREPEAAARIAELCGGLPLALRIAGSRLARKPGWTLAHLAGRLGDERRRLDELSAGDLAVRGSLALGYDGLADEERALLRSLGAFSAPDFAPWVLGGDLDALAEAGLLQSRGLDPAGQERYGWHDLTRLFAAEQLGDPSDTLNAVAGDILDRTRRARQLLLPAEPGSGLTIARTEEHLPETTLLRESAGWLAAERRFLAACVGDFHRAGLHEAAWRLAFYLTPFFELAGHHDDWHETTATGLDSAKLAGHREGEALLLRGLADLHRLEGDDQAAAAALRVAQPLVDGVEQARVTLRLGLVTGDERAFLRCLAVFEAAGDARGRADALRGLGGLRGDLGALETSLAGYRELGDPRGEAEALLDLARVHLGAGRPAVARECVERRLLINRRLGDRLPEAAGLVVLARVAGSEGRPAPAPAVQALEIFRAHGDRRGRREAAVVAVQAHLDLDDVDAAVTLIAAEGLDDTDVAAEARRRRGL
ncbi:NB-ARC domain-containing protein [Nonomuraea sp. NBC_01738]|uniref:AfsR/SARP family transcriptional regulator n=1 Tax=Nonomuraea sp. NBC_01738 TaxID=2976003 RepID=UPI002E1160CF|nr:NB-ARC domain-containing protein [Nonomuraea sp. NBC_01738]